MHRRPLLLVLFAAGCGSTPATPLKLPSNTTPPTGWAPALSVEAATLAGYLGVAPTAGDADDGAASWAPRADATVLLVDTPNVAPGTHLLAVPSRGDAEGVTAGAATQVAYGCENGQLAVVPLQGATRLPPGPVLVLPETLPEGWHPAAVDLRRTDASREQRTWTAGPLGMSLTRVDDLHATLEIRAGDRVLHRATEETYTMEGADPQTIDLSPQESFHPGVAMPEAVFLLAPDGPALVVLATQGFEGLTLSTLLVGADRAEPVETLGVYLYSCAF